MPFVGYMVCRYFLLVLILPFYPLVQSFIDQQSLTLRPSPLQLMYPFVNHTFDVKSKASLARLWS